MKQERMLVTIKAKCRQSNASSLCIYQKCIQRDKAGHCVEVEVEGTHTLSQAQGSTRAHYADRSSGLMLK